MRYVYTILLCFLVDSSLVVVAENGLDETQTRSFPLAKFLPWRESIALRNVKDIYDMSFPLPDRYLLKAAKLHLELTNSNALIRSRSQLVVRLNQTIISQIKLDPENPRTFADLELPIDKLKSGYNQIRFTAAQHYTEDECEVPDAPELWTEIDPVNSELRLDFTLRAKTPTLASIPFYIDEKLSEYPFNIVRPKPEFAGADLAWGALISQGVALRLRHVPMYINPLAAVNLNLHSASVNATSDQARENRIDTILVGKYADIKDYLSPEFRARITGPYLGIFSLGRDSKHYLLVVSGSDDAEVSLAAETFASIDYPLPDSADSVISKFERPAFEAYQMTGLVQPDTVYSFKQFGYQTISMREGDNHSIDIEVVMPPDLYAREDAEVAMQLHLAYGAAMRRDSTINISLNGVFQQAIHLHQLSGAHFRDYRVGLPLRLFQPGHNTLSFHAVLTPLETGECLYRQHKNLVVSLFDDSLLSFPPADHYARLPDLSLIGRTGFPFVRVADGSELGFQALDSSSGTVASTWQIAAKLSQINGLPLPNATLSFQPIQQDLNLILVGDSQNMDSSLTVGAPLQLGNVNQIPYPLKPIAQRVKTSFWKNWLARLSGDPEISKPADLEPKSIQGLQSGGLGQFALAMAYESPLHNDRLVLAITHQKQLGEFYQRVQALVSSGIWPLLQGDVAVWQDNSDSFAWQQTDNEFFVGETTQNSKLAFYFSLHPLVWMTVVIILLLLFAGLTHWLLNRFKTRHHPHAEELDS